MNGPQPPDVRQPARVWLQVANSVRRSAWVLVAFRYGGRWRVGVVTEWIRVQDERVPWIARVVTASEGTHGYYMFVEVRADGSILPLVLDESETTPVLRPRKPPA